MTDLFVVGDVEAISGETYAEPETTQVNRFIAIASAQLRNKVAGIDARLADGSLDRDLMLGVAAGAVIRALNSMRRGMGLRRIEYPEVTEEYAVDRYDGALVYFTDAEIADLLDTPTGGDSFSITIGAR